MPLSMNRTAWAWVVLATLASRAHAQPAQDARDARQTEPAQQQGADADAETDPAVQAPSTAVFLVPAPPFDGELLQEALRAQFALSEAKLRTLRDSERLPLGQKLAHARAIARASSDVLAVFWIDDTRPNHWFVYMMDARGDRLAVRSVEADDDARSAACDVVAVIAREFAAALLAGEPVEAERAPPPEPGAASDSGVQPPADTGPSPTSAPSPSPSPPAPPPAGSALGSDAADSTRQRWFRLRVSVGYEGTDFAPGSPLRHGIALSLQVLLPERLYAAAGSTLGAPLTVNAGIAFSLQRYPVYGAAGYRLALPAGLTLEGELGLLFDILVRTTDSTQPQADAAGYQVERASPSTRYQVALAPRVRLSFALGPVVALQLGGGVDLVTKNVIYTTKNPARYTLLAPHRVRAVVCAAATFTL